MREEFRFVIVGSGNMSNTYVAAVRKLPGLRVVGVVSRSGKKPKSWPADEPLETAASIRAIRSPFDAVILTTPNGMHRGCAVEAARLGKHVLTEKPLDVTRRACDAMIAACRKHRVKLGVVFQRRVSPDNIVVKGLLDEGKLGRVFAADLSVKFYRDQAYYGSAPYRGTLAGDGGGPFMHQASHNIDLYTWFFGLPDKVLGAIGTFLHDIEVEDHGAAILRHANGMIGTIVASTCCRPGFSARMEIFSDKGTVILENDRITLWNVEGLANPSRAPAGAIHDGATSVSVTETSGHEALIADFVQAVRKDRDPAVTGESARMATELVLKIYRAAGRK